jgi:hypothetical protein
LRIPAARQQDLDAQRKAVEAGFAKPPQRACATRPAPSASRPAAGPAGARIMRLHQGEVGR